MLALGRRERGRAVFGGFRQVGFELRREVVGRRHLARGGVGTTCGGGAAARAAGGGFGGGFRLGFVRRGYRLLGLGGHGNVLLGFWWSGKTRGSAHVDRRDTREAPSVQR